MANTERDTTEAIAIQKEGPGKGELIFDTHPRYHPAPPATGSGTRELPLTRGLFALVDDCDYEALRRYRWKAIPNGVGGYYAAARIGARLHYLHRLICGAEDLVLPGGMRKAIGCVDHRNHNTLDDTRTNLRWCSRGQNAMNSVGHPSLRRSSSKGVTKGTGSNAGKFRAVITISGCQKHLGYFRSETDAAKAYDQAASAYFGQYAMPNFPVASRAVTDARRQ